MNKLAKAGVTLSTAALLATGVAAGVWNQGELYSFHPGVINVVMGDGSTRSMKSTITLAAMFKAAAGGDGYPNDPLD